ncbi:Titin [Rhizoctonia solani]|uniref:Titin n=1 Tax=Rhizoctonia solani TaxID=456999 RepID=A0A0K6G8Y2_9AGAM|nr:Titin [Rhizoctonia solani]
MTSNNASSRRNSRSKPSADPLHILKRKRLIAEEFARDGTHSAIKKSISWGDIGKNAADSPNKQARTSLSQSITPGLSDMSTPTPINRPRSSLKSSSSQKTTLVSPQHRPGTQSARQAVGKPASILRSSQSGVRPRAPSYDTPQRPQSQPEVINLISDETPSDKNTKALNHEDRVAGTSKRITNSQPTINPPAPASPTSDVGTQYREQDAFDEDHAPASHMPLPRPNTDVAASQKRPIDHPGPRRRTSEMGIQTVPDNEVDWLDDLDADDSKSAVEISRVWAERRSGPKAGGKLDDGQTEPEPDEPLTGNFLDEFEGRSTNEERPESLDGRLGATATVLGGRDQSDERGVVGQDVDQDAPGHAPASSPPAEPASHRQPPADVVRYPHLPSSPLRFPSSPPHESAFNGPRPSVRPYSFNLQERSAGDRSKNGNNATQTDIQPRPFSSSQPNPFVTGPRARSRLYTPQPSPPRNRNSNELRAAPTLGRSMLGDIQPAIERSKSADPPSRAGSEGPDSKFKPLKAAPTLGRSTDWGHVHPSRPVTTDSNERNESNSGHQPTDYDVEYGPVPEAPSDFPSRPPSPTHSAWEIESAHTSTPHRLVTQMSTMAQTLTREDKFTKADTNTQSSTLATLEKRRRSSIAPLAESKKIRREYDTPESNAVPNLRAHKDTYDESGRRSWVPKRPNMKRALDAPAPDAKKTLRSKYPSTVEEEPEPTEDVHEQVPPESAAESRAETFHPVSYGEFMQEHQMELDEQPGQALGDKVSHPPTEIAETPQSTRIRNPYDLATSDLPSHEFASEQPEPEQATPLKSTDYAYILPPNPSDANGAQEDELLAVNATQEGEPAPVIEPAAPSSRIKSTRRARSDERSIRKSSSRPKRPSSGLHITPARQPIWSPPRTRLSMGGRSGISVLQASKSDQEILVQAGLRPVLKRLSQAHGFTVDVVAEVYQEAGSLKEAEDTLEKMKHSAERTRVSISRRRSTLEVSRREEQNTSERDSSEVSGANNDYLNWDTSRVSNRILFGEGL